MTDWNAIRSEYITTPTSYQKLADKYGLQKATIAHRAAKEKWVEQKQRHDTETASKILAASSKKKVNRAKRVRDAADRLLEKVEQAISELDRQMVTHKDKVKTIKYDNPKRPDKPTEETVHETEQVLSVSSIIDRKGLQQIAVALKEIRQIHGIQSELDKQEQLARIKNLEGKAEKSDGDSSVIEVVFDAGPEEWNE